MSGCRTTCKASIRWIAKAANGLIAGALVFALGACEQQANAGSCAQLRGTFDKAFENAVHAATRKAADEQRKFITEGQNAYLAMERRGCCRDEGVCPPMNVH
jgi:hypothetical protein